jgi:hypothetical protein
MIDVIVAGSTAGSATDCTTTGAAAASNQTATFHNTVGVYWLDVPHQVGITIVPGTSQVLAAAWY